MSISIKIDDTQVRAALSKLGNATHDLTPAMRDIGDGLVSRVVDGFQQGKAPNGEAWEPLQQATMLGRLKRSKRNFRKNGRLSAQGRRAASAGFQPLLDTGNLRNSITRKADKHGVEIGTDVLYAATQQFGDERRGIPARPFLPTEGLPHDWQAEVVDALALHLEKVLRG